METNSPEYFSTQLGSVHKTCLRERINAASNFHKERLQKTFSEAHGTRSTSYLSTENHWKRQLGLIGFNPYAWTWTVSLAPLVRQGELWPQNSSCPSSQTQTEACIPRTFNPENRVFVAMQMTTTSPRLPCENTTFAHRLFCKNP